jgi:hypothetical protein
LNSIQNIRTDVITKAIAFFLDNGRFIITKEAITPRRLLQSSAAPMA